ncbi:MAG: phosphoglycerate kinase, partial [Parcubacteria group bacterium Gr01-1014_70]
MNEFGTIHKLPVYTADIDVRDKRVLLRVDFNVPTQGGAVTDDFRIIKTLPLLKALIDRGAHVLVLSHLTEKKEHRSFIPLLAELERICGMKFLFANTVEAAKDHLLGSPLVLFENLRAFAGEEINDAAFAKEIASLGDLYINEDFSQSHRSYATIMTLPRLVPSYAGPLFFEETKKLGEVLEPEHPSMLIVGGAKFKTKVGILERFLEKADSLFVGGALANTFLAARGYSLGASLVESDAMEHIREKFLSQDKVLLPLDIRTGDNTVRRVEDIQIADLIYD